VLAVGPAARDSDFGAIGSAPVKKGELTHVDTWAGRGGFGSKLFQEHGLVGIIYGGTHIVEENFRDRSMADQWFQDKFNQRAAEQLNHHADRLGFDAISVGATLAWLMDCLDAGLIFSLRIGMPPPTSFGTKYTKASMRCFGNIQCDENFFRNAVVRFMIERII